jgi:TonB-dependent starch-binding outer membrane protein SusC
MQKNSTVNDLLYKVMRITVIQMTVAMIFSGMAIAHENHAQEILNRKISLQLREVSLIQALHEIEQATNVKFVYSPNHLNLVDVVTLDAAQQKLGDILGALLTPRAIQFRVQEGDDYILLIEQRDPAGSADTLKTNQEVVVQSALITGVVIDASTKQPMAGVNVIRKGTTSGTSTDADGKYSITAEDNDILVFSFIGFKITETAVNGRTVIDMTLEEEFTSLGEVVINAGYYKTTEKTRTGNISKVSAEEIEKQPVSNPVAALQGRVAGLDIVQQSGLPGTGFTIRLRGQNSLRDGANSPLVLIDGIPYTTEGLNHVGDKYIAGYVDINPLNSINPADIESIEVLKDADATAIYGSRGGNGVILITTKKGKPGKTAVTVNVSTGVGNIDRKLEVLNTEEYLEMRHNAIRADGYTLATAPAYSTYDLTRWDTTRYTDWQEKLIGGTARYTKAQFSISGGNEYTTINFAGNFSREGTVYPIDLANKRYNGRLSVNHSSPNRKFNFQFSSSYGVDNNELPSLSTIGGTVVPIAPPLYDSLGNLNWGPPGPAYTHPLAFLEDRYSGNVGTLTSSGVIGYQVLSGLQLKTAFGFNSIHNRATSKRPSTFHNPIAWPSLGEALRTAQYIDLTVNTWNVEPQAEYIHKVGPGIFSGLIGTTFQQTVRDGTQVSAFGFADDGLLGNPAFALRTTSSVNETKYLYHAIFLRLNYNYNDKYIINLTARRDGSSRFGPGKRFGNFGAAGFIWTFSEENLVKHNVGFLNFGKLRASYGISGNDEIGDYGYVPTYTPFNQRPGSPVSYAGGSAFTPDRVPNLDFSWETNKKAEVALELGFFQNRVVLNTSFYRNRSSSQLVNYDLPIITGFSSVQENLPAIIQNKGLEIELQTTNIQRGNFMWTSTFNITFPKNELISYPNLEASAYAYQYMEGHPLTIRKAYDFINVDPATGLNVFATGEGGTTSDARTLGLDDLTVAIDVGKKYYGGLGNTFRYKGFQVDIFLQFSKQTGFASPPNLSYPLGGMSNIPKYIYDRTWKNPGDIAQFQKLTSIGAGTPTYLSTINYTLNENFYQDVTFVRVKNVAITYTLPVSWRQKIRMQDCRIYVQGQNLFTVTDYDGMDPENLSAGLPPLRVITAGLQFSL